MQKSTFDNGVSKRSQNDRFDDACYGSTYDGFGPRLCGNSVVGQLAVQFSCGGRQRRQFGTTPSLIKV